jgi:hypothetical protein
MRSHFHTILILASLATPAVGAAAPSEPRAFLRHVITYETSGRGGLRSRALLASLTPRFREAIQKDTRGPDIGVLDYDPICQCQDDDGLSMRVVTLEVKGSTAVAVVENTFFDSKRWRVSFRLENGNHGWRLADVTTADCPSLLKMLERANRKVR